MDCRGSTSGLESDLKLAVDEPGDDPGIVHDLGNLIQIATSAISLVRRKSGAGRDPAVEPVLARASTALERAGVLVRQALGRTRQPTLVMRKSPDLQDVAACLDEIRDLIQWVCDPDIRLSADAGRDLPSVRCSRIDLQSAVLNLVINERDAMPSGGCLSLSAHSIRLGDLSPGVAIAVGDDGVGMSPETLARALNPFFTTKRDGLGTGLGLAMVQRFALDAGGRVDIASALGVGTTVTLRLPSSPAADTMFCEDFSA